MAEPPRLAAPLRFINGSIRVASVPACMPMCRRVKNTLSCLARTAHVVIVAQIGARPGWRAGGPRPGGIGRALLTDPCGDIGWGGSWRGRDYTWECYGERLVGALRSIAIL